MTPDRRLVLPILLLSCGLAGGCSPVGMAVGAAATAGVAASQERGIVAAVDDTVVLADLNRRLLQQGVGLFADITVEVVEGRVLLTGAVVRPESRVEAVRIAWETPGVRRVLNEIQVRDEASLFDKGRDALVANELRGTLMLDRDVDSINYSIDVVNAVVYIIGIAKSREELDRVTDHARSQAYVKGVVRHVRVAGESRPNDPGASP